MIKIALDPFFVPEAVVRNMLRTGQIPTTSPRWMDERICCRYARQDDQAGAAHCPQLASEPHCRPWCRLNGRQRQTPCVFDEPPTANIWQRIEEQRQYDQD